LKNDVIGLKKIIEPYNVSELYVYAPDEQSLDNLKNRAQIKAVHEAGGRVFDAQINTSDTVADILDLAVTSGEPNPQLAHQYHNYSHKIFSYSNPQVGEEKPETYRRNYGLLLWQKDYDGAMDFAYQWGVKNIWDDFDDPIYRNHVFAYPTVNGVIDTIQYEGFREGVDDIRYLTTLFEAIRKAKLEGQNTTDIEKWLANLKSSNLDKQDLDVVRATMINHILFLENLNYPNLSTSHSETIQLCCISAYSYEFKRFFEWLKLEFRRISSYLSTYFF
jgi:hypothetical protein